MYASRGFRGAERNRENYSSRKLDLIGLKWAVTEKFWEYLIPSAFTDDNLLKYMQAKCKLKAVEQGWVLEFASFNFNMKYRAGRHTIRMLIHSSSGYVRDAPEVWDVQEVEAELAA